MENKNISQIALERIKGEGIKPISRKVFSIKRVIFWVVVVLSLVVGAFVFSLVLSGFFNNDWYLYNKLGFNFIFKTLPYFWFFSLILFTILGEYYYRKTLLGHRHSFIFIMGIYMVSTLVLGSVVYMCGISDTIEQSLEDSSPVYSNIMLNRHGVWYHPEDGLLSGRIIQIGEQDIQIVDTNGIVWVVSIDNASPELKTEIEIGQRVKIIGDQTDNNSFNADEIRPWMGMWAIMR